MLGDKSCSYITKLTLANLTVLNLSNCSQNIDESCVG